VERANASFAQPAGELTKLGRAASTAADQCKACSRDSQRFRSTFVLFLATHGEESMRDSDGSGLAITTRMTCRWLPLRFRQEPRSH
jgi:hypothetical protein